MGIYISFGLLLHISFNSTIYLGTAKLGVQSRQSRNKSTFPFMGTAKALEHSYPVGAISYFWRYKFSAFTYQSWGIWSYGSSTWLLEHHVGESIHLLKLRHFDPMVLLLGFWCITESKDQFNPSASHANSGHFSTSTNCLILTDRLLPLVLTLFGFSISISGYNKILSFMVALFPHFHLDGF